MPKFFIHEGKGGRELELPDSKILEAFHKWQNGQGEPIFAYVEVNGTKGEVDFRKVTGRGIFGQDN